jgi:hypothetical protein
MSQYLLYNKEMFLAPLLSCPNIRSTIKICPLYLMAHQQDLCTQRLQSSAAEGRRPLCPAAKQSSGTRLSAPQLSCPPATCMASSSCGARPPGHSRGRKRQAQEREVGMLSEICRLWRQNQDSVCVPFMLTDTCPLYPLLALA